MERDRPSRSDSRLEERTADFGALVVGAGETDEPRGNKTDTYFTL